MPVVMCSKCSAELHQVKTQEEARIAFRIVKKHERKYHLMRKCISCNFEAAYGHDQLYFDEEGRCLNCQKDAVKE